MISAFCGCSYVEGVGLDGCSLSNDLWVNQLHKQLLSHTQLFNLGKGGSNNEEIFTSAIKAATTICPQYLFVCWTELFRYKINPSVELYPTGIFWSNGPGQIKDITFHPNVTIPGSYISDIKNRFFDLQHPHYKIVQILEWSSILHDLCNKLGIQVFFLNSLIRVDQGYFNHIDTSSRLPSDTTLTTREFFNAETRDDKEFFQIYDNVHREYKNTHGLNCCWVNIDFSFRRNFYIDKGNDDLHPGIESNKLYADFVKNKLQNYI